MTHATSRLLQAHLTLNVVESSNMDFTTSEQAGFVGGFRNRESNPNLSANTVPAALPMMSCFSELPNQNDPHSSPVLVMPTPPPLSRRALWARRISLVVFVLFCLEVGVILTWCPWTRLWSENSILVSYPRLREFLMLGFVRGGLSGLGLVNIWMGIAEAVRYREGHD
jgi:hypothetical protein